MLLKQLDITATTSPFSEGTTTVTYKIYTQSSNTLEGGLSQPRPDIQSLAYSSSPSSFSSTHQDVVTGQNTQLDTQVPFNYDFTPGSYWLTEEGTGPTVVRFDSIAYDSASGNVAQTPEPPVFFLFLMLAGFIILKTNQHNQETAV